LVCAICTGADATETAPEMRAVDPVSALAAAASANAGRGRRAPAVSGLVGHALECLCELV
jgi:hypothetical protein